MKLSQSFTVLLLIAVHVTCGDGKPQHFRRRAAVADGLLQEYGKIMSGDSRGDACIELSSKEYNQVDKTLIIGDCKTTGSSGWRFGLNGKIHSEYNDEYCIQVASHEGARLKLLPCDPDNDNPLQNFVYHNHGKAIRPKKDDTLCVTYEGNHADIGTDKLILKKCDKIESQRHWIGNFPRSSDENQQQHALEEGSV